MSEQQPAPAQEPPAGVEVLVHTGIVYLLAVFDGAMTWRESTDGEVIATPQRWWPLPAVDASPAPVATPPVLDVEAKARAYLAHANEMVKCDRCKGTGYHHGFGEDGRDPDWCESCGGPGWMPHPDSLADPEELIAGLLSRLAAVSPQPAQASRDAGAETTAAIDLDALKAAVAPMAFKRGEARLDFYVRVAERMRARENTVRVLACPSGCTCGSDEPTSARFGHEHLGWCAIVKAASSGMILRCPECGYRPCQCEA